MTSDELSRRLYRLEHELSDIKRATRDKGHLLIIVMLFCLCAGWCP